jgi:hypothetical protein
MRSDELAGKLLLITHVKNGLQQGRWQTRGSHAFKRGKGCRFIHWEKRLDTITRRMGSPQDPLHPKLEQRGDLREMGVSS